MTLTQTITAVWSQVKYFVAAAGVIGTIGAASWVAAMWVHDKDSKDTINQTEVSQLNTKLDSVIVSVKVLSDIKEDVSDLKTNVRELKTGQKNLVGSMADHMAKDDGVTKKDLVDFMKQFDQAIKKNDLTPFSIR
jgi:hypothetical protein